MTRPPKTLRAFDQKALQRARMVETMLLPEYLSNIMMHLSIAVDDWRFHHGDPDEVVRGVDALLAVWSEIEIRSQAVTV